MSTIETTNIDWMIEPRNGISSGQIGNWYYDLVGSTDDVWFVFYAPKNFVSLDEAVVVMIPDATETIQWDVDASASAKGVLYNNDDRSASNQQLAVTNGQLSEADISGVLGGISAKDYLAIRFQSDTISMRILGLRFSYIGQIKRV